MSTGHEQNLTIKVPLGQRQQGSYKWFWHGNLSSVPSNFRNWKIGNNTAQFSAGCFDHVNGRISDDASDQNNLRVVTLKYSKAAEELPSVPSSCPCCLVKRYNKSENIESGSVNSPIAAMGTGIAISNRLLASHASTSLASLDKDRPEPSVIFSDQREGAAEIAAGVEIEHFSNLTRQVVTEILSSASEAPTEEELKLAMRARQGSEEYILSNLSGTGSRIIIQKTILMH